MNENILVSVIIPIYNVESYLNQCVDSILNQTYVHIEVILIDDGSPDNSGRICDEYAEKDSRVSVIHKANGGLSDARNEGLKVAKGDYVIFMDSDDFWKNNICLQRLIIQLEKLKYPDMLGFNLYYYFPSKDQYIPWISYDDSITNEWDKNELIVRLVRSGTFPMSACSKLLKKSSLDKHAVTFVKGIFAEDIPWFIDILDKFKEIRFVDEYVYCYRQGVSTSITGSCSTMKFDDLYNNLIHLIPFICQSSLNQQAKEALLSFCAYEYCILMGSIRFLNKPDRNKRFRGLKQMGWLMEYDLNPKVGRVGLIYKYLGFSITSYFCHLFLVLKKS